MRVVQITIDPPLLREVDREVRRRKTKRSAFIRESLLAALRRSRMVDLEEQHRRGYSEYPSEDDEIKLWERIQSWPKP